MNYGGGMVSLVTPKPYFKLCLIMIKSCCCVRVPYLGLIGVYFFELKCLGYSFDVDEGVHSIRMMMFINMPHYEAIWNVLSSLIWIMMKGIVLMQFLLIYDL